MSERTKIGLDDLSSSAGCLPMIGIAAVAVGAGIVLGGGWGWITFGGACLIAYGGMRVRKWWRRRGDQDGLKIQLETVLAVSAANDRKLATCRSERAELLSTLRNFWCAYDDVLNAGKPERFSLAEATSIQNTLAGHAKALVDRLDAQGRPKQ